MAEPTENTVVDQVSETVVIALELADDEIGNTPGRIIKALESADVQKALKKALEEFAKAKLRSAPVTVSEEDAKELGKKLLEKGGEAVADNVVSQIKTTAKYRALDQSLQALSTTFKQTPMGVFLDENKTLLYIVGVGAVLGGAAAMYITRTGDTVTKEIMPLVGGKSVPFKLLGKLKMEAGVEKVVFTPSERLVEAKTFVTGKWKQIEVRLNLAVTAADGKFTAQTSGKIVIPLPHQIKLQGGGSYDTANKDWSLNVSVGVNVKGILQVGVLAGVGRGGIGKLPESDAFRALPEPPKESGRVGGFLGLGVSASF